MLKRTILSAALLGGLLATIPGAGPGMNVAHAQFGACGSEWEQTDFSRRSVELDEIMSGGPCKDRIPSIDAPEFVPVAEAGDLSATEPVIGLSINGDARAYPLRILTWHEIVNDVVGGVPVAVTYCPLCNAAIVFERTVDGTVLEFGTTGKLRKSDLVMYDRQTESWWQQFLGEAIVGEMTGKKLRFLPARLEAWERFTARHPDGRVQVPTDPGIRWHGSWRSEPRPGRSSCYRASGASRAATW
jgi:hypothetical protein